MTKFARRLAGAGWLCMVVSALLMPWQPGRAADPATDSMTQSRYQPVAGGYRIVNSSDVFNRSLYGGHQQDNLRERYFTMAGDRPIMLGALIHTNGGGSNAKCGTLMMGVATTPGLAGRNKYGIDSASQWFHTTGSVVATYRNGWIEYDVEPMFQVAPQVKAHIEVLPLDPDDGLLVHVRVWSEGRVQFCMGFGGITDYVGLVASPDVEARQFRPEDCRGNTVVCGKNRGRVQGPMSTMWIGTNIAVETSLGDASLAVEGPGRLLARDQKPTDSPMVRMSCEIRPGQAVEGNIVVVRTGDEKILERWLGERDAVGLLKGKIAEKLAGFSVQTPDPMLNLTVPSNMLGMDACWNQRVFCHGGTHWHSPYLGWRNWYGPTVLGWHERVATCFRTHAARLMLDDKYGDGCIPDNLAGRSFGYNMQEVAVDMWLHHLEWTGDLGFAREMFDTVTRVLNYERRVFDPEDDGLYRNQLNTWVSDAHWYNGGGCAQASAYNFRANRLMAEVARKLEKPAGGNQMRAERIRRAMQERLWMPAKGILAEYVDTVGNRLVHPSPELATIYHAIECEAVDPFQAHQMLRFTETDLRNERTAGRQGRLVWSSNWYPQHYSNCGLYPGENIHLAWAYYANGQALQGKKILDGIVDAHFLGKTPGAVGHCMNGSGLNAGALDFADTVSMYLRLVVEGLFGVRFKLLEDRIEIAPHLPPDWDRAELTTPDVGLTYRRTGEEEEFQIRCSKPALRQITLPLRRTRVEAVRLNGRACTYRIEPRINSSVVVVETRDTGPFWIYLRHAGSAPPGLRFAARVEGGQRATIAPNAGTILEWKDPSGLMADARREGETLEGNVAGSVGGHTLFVLVKEGDWKGWLAADLTVARKPKPARPEPSGSFVTVDISRQMNISLADIHVQKYEHPRGPDGVAANGRSRWDDGAHGGPYQVVVRDEALRRCGGVFRTPGGVPFATPATGVNAACASMWDNFPKQLSIPLTGRGTELAILLVGVTNPMQARVENARLSVNYTDGSTELVKLEYPTNFDDWLDPAVQAECETVYFSDYNHAIVQRIVLDPAKELRSLTVEAVANEVIVGTLGVSVRR